MLEDIREMSNNIGSLSLFLNNSKNIKYLDFLNNNIPIEIINFKISEKVYYLLNNIKEPILCSCGEHKSFIGFKNGYRETCGKKECFVKQRKKTNIEKYGVDNPLKDNSIKLKVKNTNIEKYGVSSPMKNDKIKQKFKNTMLDRHGVEWAQQSDNIKIKSNLTWNKNENKEQITSNRIAKLRNKSPEEKKIIQNKKMETILNKWGTHYMNTEPIKNKVKDTYIYNYGFDSPFKNKNIAEKRIESYKNRTKKILSKILKSDYSYIDHYYNKNKTGIVIDILHIKCNTTFNMNGGYFKNRLELGIELCLNCNPILSGKSNRELEVLSFIEEVYSGVIEKNIKNIIKGELDIFIPEKMIAFEFNGLYWHSELYKDKLYHLNKTLECNKKGITLIHIWEDDWDNKKDIIKSIILNKLNLTPNRIFARKCQIKEITDNSIIREFLNKNHIQGFVGSKVKLGLFHNNELVSLMTFGNLRKSLGQKSSDGDYELLRFCNKLDTTVVGGASKLFNYFIKNYSPNYILSYSDLSRGNGNLYEKLGFNKEYQTNPNYYWVIDNIKVHRFNYRKDILVKMGEDPSKTEVETMHNKGHYRVFDCGNIKWIKNF